MTKMKFRVSFAWISLLAISYLCVTVHCTSDITIEHQLAETSLCADGEEGDEVCRANGTVCKSDTKLKYKCVCESGYAQNRICSVSDLYCKNKGAVRSVLHHNITLCLCEKGQFFDYSMLSCPAVDTCPFIKCKDKYAECQGGQCRCKTAYEERDGQCKPRNYCQILNKCGSAKCEAGPEDDPKDIRCYCDSGYILVRERRSVYCKLVQCEIDTLNPCDQICLYSNDKKSVECDCFPGHTLKDSITCDLQPSHKCSYNSCDSKSICVKLNDTNECLCKNNWIGRGECLDRCAARKVEGVCPSDCRSTENGYQCICKGKYKLSHDNVTCEERRMCSPGEEGQLSCAVKNKTCKETPETDTGFTCGECTHELQEHEGNCTDLCEVDEYKTQCEMNGARCTFVDSSTRQVKCKCRPLFVWKKYLGCVFAPHSYTTQLRIANGYQRDFGNSSILENGEGNFDMKKLDHDIEKSMLALYGKALSQVNVLECWSDEQSNLRDSIVCSIELQLYFKDYGILGRINSYSVCSITTGVSQEFCFIPPFLKLLPRDRYSSNTDAPFSRSDPCGSQYGGSLCPAATKCVQENVGFSCRCRDGFVVKYSVFLNGDKTGIIEVCEDINECEIRNPCPSGSTCVNTIGSFLCPCLPGLFRWNVSENPENDACTGGCDSVICRHGQCENHTRGFYCRCPTGYSGVFCEEPLPNQDKNDCGGTGTGRTVLITVGVIEAFILVVFIVLAIIFRRFWIRHKNADQEQSVVSRRATKEGVRSLNIEHLHMRGISDVGFSGPRANGRHQTTLAEETDEPIYADCALR